MKHQHNKWNKERKEVPVISMDLELLGSVHSLQRSKALDNEGEFLRILSDCETRKMTNLQTCNGTLLDPVTNWRNLARSVWSKLLRARQNLKSQIMRCIVKIKLRSRNSPDNLETGDAVLVVLCVRLQVVNVNVWQPWKQQLQLLLVEDHNRPEQRRN